MQAQAKRDDATGVSEKQATRLTAADEMAAAVAAIDEDMQFESIEEQSAAHSDKKDVPNIAVPGVAAVDAENSEKGEGTDSIGERNPSRAQIDSGVLSGLSADAATANAATKDRTDLDIELMAIADELALEDDVVDGGEDDDESINLEEMALELADGVEDATLEELAAQLSLG